MIQSVPVFRKDHAPAKTETDPVAPYHGDEHGRFVGRWRGTPQPAQTGVMAEINVTPMVDVMLVLLIIFVVSAPLLTVGVPLDLPQTQAKSLEQDKTPLQLFSVDTRGRVFINDTEVAMNELIPN